MMEFCECVLQIGLRRGQVCGDPVIISERFCMVCIIKNYCQDRVSEKFKKYRRDLELLPLVLVQDRFFISGKYGFVVEYNGEMYLKGMFDGYHQNKINYKIREATEEEKKIAIKLNLK